MSMTGDPWIDNLLRFVMGAFVAWALLKDRLVKAKEKDIILWKNKAEENEQRYEEQRKISHQLRERMQALEIEVAELRMKTNFEPTERLLHELIGLIKSGALLCPTGKQLPPELSQPFPVSPNS